ASGEEKSRCRKRAAPAAQCRGGQRRRNQSAPRQRETLIESYLFEHRLEEIGAGIIAKRRPRMQWMIRPNGLPRSEHLGVEDVAREIAEIVGRAHAKNVAVKIKQPAKGAHREKAKYNPKQHLPARDCLRLAWPGLNECHHPEEDAYRQSDFGLPH